MEGKRKTNEIYFNGQIYDAYSNIQDIFKSANDTFHDRYFIIDKKDVYHCGANINRIGYKTFSINLIIDEDMRNLLICKINNIML